MPKVGMKPVRQAQLIEATLSSVEQFGLHGTTVGTISKIAGVSSGIISHYFGGKQELLEATVRFLLKSLNEELMNQLRIKGDSPIARLEAIIHTNFSPFQTSERGAKTWLAFWAQSMHDERLARLQRVNEKRLRSNLKYSLNSLLPKEKVADTAEAIAALIDGLWLRGALNGGDIKADKAAVICKNFLHETIEFHQN
ncbi:transcriptional regulator BetI [Litoribacillus peritrichatus]|uniref:HTH-type transcriptional regulator BetI n=1 Tax=Litoribacillus peritrichatus TaxID=718191 RepID=A0ABP7MXA2_9GAMM